MGPENSGQQKKGGGIAKWLVGGCLLVLLCLGGCVGACVTMVRGGMINSDAYKLALDKASSHSKVVEKLGEPLQLNAFMPSGNVSVQNDSGSANLQIPVKGSKGTGVISVQATKTAGKWSIDAMTCTVDKTGEVINISGPDAKDKN